MMIIAPMTKWTKEFSSYNVESGHSCMKIPTEKIMEHAYKTYVLNKNKGIKAFGRYNSAAFSDLDPVDTSTNSE